MAPKSVSNKSYWRLWFPVGMLALMAHSALGQTQEKYDALREQFNQRLEELATTCERQNLKDQAAQTRKLILRRDPNRQYFFIPHESDPWQVTRPSDDTLQWFEGLGSIRSEYAAALYALVGDAITAGEKAKAFAWLHEVCATDPEHEPARRILGYHKVNDRWLETSTPTSAKKARSRQPLLDWSANDYLVVDSPHYQIASRASEDQSLDLAHRLERWRIVWRQTFFDYWSTPQTLASLEESAAPSSPTRKHKVFFFKDRDEYVRHLTRLGAEGIEKSTGFYSDRHQSLFLYMDDPPPLDTWMHEQAHQLFQESASARKDPVERSHVWVLEGIAMYFESLVDHGPYVSLGGFDHSRLQFARINLRREGFFEPFDNLTRLGRTAFQNHPDVGKLYSQSAGMVHFLMSDQGGKYRPAILQLLKQIYQRRAKLDSLEEYCGVNLAQLEKEYKSHLTVDRDNVKSFLSDPDRRTEFALGFSNVDSSIGPVLDQCPQLRWMQLSRTSVDDDLGPTLSRLKKLEQLFLDHTAVSDKILDSLVDLPKLEELDLADTDISDEGLKIIAKMTGLKALWLGGTKITDREIQQLATLRQLQFLDIQRTEVTPEAYRQLKQRLPNLK